MNAAQARSGARSASTRMHTAVKSSSNRPVSRGSRPPSHGCFRRPVRTSLEGRTGASQPRTRQRLGRPRVTAPARRSGSHTRSGNASPLRPLADNSRLRPVVLGLEYRRLPLARQVLEAVGGEQRVVELAPLPLTHPGQRRGGGGPLFPGGPPPPPPL